MARILIVDDEHGIRELFSEILGDEGHQVILADCAAEARRLRKLHEPDLILLDIWMPDTDGVSLLKEWSQAGTLHAPVIMMSGHGTIDTAVEATHIGAVNYLEKPVALVKLLEAVNNALSVSILSDRKSALHTSTASEAKSAYLETDDRVESSRSVSSSSVQNWQRIFQLPLREAREAFDKLYFESAMQQTGGKVSELIKLSGLERSNVYRKLKQFGIKSS